jgi:hypothetical protein
MNMHRVLPALVLVAVVGAACSKGSGGQGATPAPRPRSTAKLQIVSPTNGQVFKGASVTVPVELSLEGARIVAATTTNITPDTGHVHLYLDNQIVTMNFSLTDQVPNVTPGSHILRAEFVASDHLPFDPRVFVSVTFKVEP